jgi:hypothetical protein
MFKACAKHTSVPVKVEVEITIVKIIGIPEKYNILRFGIRRKRKHLTTSVFTATGLHDAPEARIQYNCTLYATKPNAQTEVKLFWQLRVWQTFNLTC